MYTAFDTANHITPNTAEELVAKGYRAVGLYGRADRSPFDLVQGILKAGLKIWTIQEHGNPTQASYFSEDQAKADAEAFLSWASMVGQPKGTGVFPTADYDSNPNDILPYARVFHDIIKAEGFLMGIYANGVTCKALKDAGLAHWDWLTQSTGFEGYEMWKPHTSIIQEPSGTVLGLDVDFNVIQTTDLSFLW
jgi:Domain of unknown function (DUF1906)